MKSIVILAGIGYSILASIGFTISSREMIIASTICAIATAINITFCTTIGLRYSNISTKKWIESASGNRTLYNNIQPMLLIWLSSLFGSRFMGWKHEWSDWRINIIHLFIMMIGVDIGFYFVHYLFHTIPYLQKKHAYHHDCDMKTVGSLCTLDDDYFEAFLRDYLPVVLSSFLCYDFHIYTYNLFYIIYTWWAFYIHSTLNTYHSNHHKYYNCNYGVFYITDYIMGSIQLLKK